MTNLRRVVTTCSSRLLGKRRLACHCPSASCFEPLCRSEHQVLVEEIEVNEEDILPTSHPENDVEEPKKAKKDHKIDRASRNSTVSFRNICSCSLFVLFLSAAPMFGTRPVSVGSHREEGRETQAARRAAPTIIWPMTSKSGLHS